MIDTSELKEAVELVFDKQNFNALAYEKKVYSRYECEHEYSELEAYVHAVIESVQFLISVVICSIKGHKFVDTSAMGDAESGYFGMECTRCGFEHHGYW